MGEETSDVGVCLRQLDSGHKILICGNGGSAAEASHFAAELVVRYKVNRGPLACIALNDPAILTACANDFGYEWVFSRQVLAYGKAGDVLIALSTSGKSANVLNAIEAARLAGLYVLEAPRPKGDTAYIQARQLDWLHHLAACIEEQFSKSKPPATSKNPIQ